MFRKFHRFILKLLGGVPKNTIVDIKIKQGKYGDVAFTSQPLSDDLINYLGNRKRKKPRIQIKGEDRTRGL